MTWQDIILSVGLWLASVALLPSILGKDKPPLSTSILNVIIITAAAIVYVTLHLWLSVVATAILSLAWLTLAVQKFFNNAVR